MTVLSNITWRVKKGNNIYCRYTHPSKNLPMQIDESRCGVTRTDPRSFYLGLTNYSNYVVLTEIRTSNWPGYSKNSLDIQEIKLGKFLQDVVSKWILCNLHA